MRFSVILISDSVIVFDRNIAIGFSTTILLKFNAHISYKICLDYYNAHPPN